MKQPVLIKGKKRQKNYREKPRKNEVGSVFAFELDISGVKRQIHAIHAIP